jgi:hypothetical protein
MLGMLIDSGISFLGFPYHLHLCLYHILGLILFNINKPAQRSIIPLFSLLEWRSKRLSLCVCVLENILVALLSTVDLDPLVWVNLTLDIYPLYR